MEALRLYPSVPLEVKLAAKDDVLPDGSRIQSGDVVTISIYSMGRSRKIWGENATEFVPSRWLQDDFKPSDYQYHVFNAMPRRCLGKTMATVEAKLLLATLFKRYQFKLAPEHDPTKLGRGATLSFTNGLLVTVTKRN